MKYVGTSTGFSSIAAAIALLEVVALQHDVFNFHMSYNQSCCVFLFVLAGKSSVPGKTTDPE